MAKIERTTAGLRDALFDAIEKVRGGDMLAPEAIAIAKLSKEICGTVSLEMDVAKLRMSYPSDGKIIAPTPLDMVSNDQKVSLGPAVSSPDTKKLGLGTAVWLVENTSLTFDQIADACGVNPVVVNSIADGEFADSVDGRDPICSGHLNRDEIARAERDESYRLRVRY